MSDQYQPLNLSKWIEENRHLLKPPVGNKVVWRDREFIVMIVGGPNERTDFHVNEGEEFFYQLEGQATLKIVNRDGKMQDIVLNGGDIYLLPPKTPHSPQRVANSVGLVIERQRRDGELDGLQWFCEKCQNKLYEEFFKLTNIETQFPAVFERYYGSVHTKCKSCGFKNGRKWSHA
ncbi:MAG: 3-hydroxyanthranilate 3,4-dioxygenase [Bacteriovorax sp.]|jgi:3-hydroxyanthranilate 3,4-dioxygenase